MRIGLCGTMSVGKTTLVNALKELPEFKDYTFRTERSKYLMEQGIPLNTDSTLKGSTSIFSRTFNGAYARKYYHRPHHN
jgi:GTPase SAR1 family protein